MIVELHCSEHRSHGIDCHLPIANAPLADSHRQSRIVAFPHPNDADPPMKWNLPAQKRFLSFRNSNSIAQSLFPSNSAHFHSIDAEIVCLHPISTSFRPVTVATVHPNQVEILHHVHFPGQSPLLYHSNTVGAIHTEHSNETKDLKFPEQRLSFFQKSCDAVVLFAAAGEV